MDGKWEVHDIKDVYESERVKLQVADVELPDKSRIEHALITAPPGAGSSFTIVSVENKGTLMIWRHRFATDRWTWELPGGRVEKRETHSKAAERELLEETGWQSGKLQKLLTFQPLNSYVDHEMHGFITREATFTDQGRDTNEVADIAWLSVEEIETLIEKGDVSDGVSLTFLLYAMNKGLLKN